MKAPLDLTVEELNIYTLLYRKVDFNSWMSDYTLEQLALDSHRALNISKRIAQRIIDKLIKLDYLEVVVKGVKGKPTTYKIKIENIFDDERYESVTNVLRIGNESVTNDEPIATPRDDERYENGTNSVRMRYESVTPIIKTKIKTKTIKTFSSDSIEYRLCQVLFNLMKNNNPKCKEPNFQKWCKDIDLMIRCDKRTPEEIESIIRFSQTNNFWKANILSAQKLREKFDTLTMQNNKNSASQSIDVTAADF
jgi:hypothetical protein